jgi:hypothetical protein
MARLFRIKLKRRRARSRVFEVGERGSNKEDAMRWNSKRASFVAKPHLFY